jgi:hypothetical protein
MNGWRQLGLLARHWREAEDRQESSWARLRDAIGGPFFYRPSKQHPDGFLDGPNQPGLVEPYQPAFESPAKEPRKDDTRSFPLLPTDQRAPAEGDDWRTIFESGSGEDTPSDDEDQHKK